MDDNPTFLAAVRQSLTLLPEAQVVGEAHDGQQALDEAAALQPDLVLLDIAMPRMGGLEVAQAMQSWPRSPRILFLSMHDNASYRLAARELGAVGFVGKADFVIKLLPLIEALVADQPAIQPKALK